MSALSTIDPVVLPVPIRLSEENDEEGGPVTPVRFCVVCGAGQVHLRLAGGALGETPRLLPMELRWGCRWELTVPLRPGAYRYRYFVRDGNVTVSMPPAESAESVVDGMDGLLRIDGRGGAGEPGRWIGAE